MQKLLKYIDTAAEHYEIRPPSHKNRLLQNMHEEQSKDIQYKRKEKREECENACVFAKKIDVFSMGLILIENSRRNTA